MTQPNYFLLTQLYWVQSYDLIQLISVCRFKRAGFHSLFRIIFNYLDSGVLPFTFYLEYGERRSQYCSDGHDWFSPDLTLNILGQ